MVKISNNYHRTRQGVVKRNPIKRNSVIHNKIKCRSCGKEKEKVFFGKTFGRRSVFCKTCMKKDRYTEALAECRSQVIKGDKKW